MKYNSTITKHHLNTTKQNMGWCLMLVMCHSTQKLDNRSTGSIKAQKKISLPQSDRGSTTAPSLLGIYSYKPDNALK